MLYLGHFSFAEEPGAGAEGHTKPWHGYFTCMAEADELYAALQQFKDLIRRLRDRDDMFEGVERIYLDSCIEIRTVPTGGFLAHFTVREGEDLGGISTAVRGATDDEAEALHLGSDDEDDDDEGEPREQEPFIVFEPTGED